MKKITILLSILFFLTIKNSNSQDWLVDQNSSKINVKFKNSNLEIVGSFKSFDAKIFFDKNNPAKCDILIKVDTSSIHFEDKEFINNAKNANWLDVAKFPISTFKSKKCQTTINKNYLVEGDLVIKGLKLPAVIELGFKDYNKNFAYATGSLKIEREKYQIGNSDKDKNQMIGKIIEVNFEIKANRKIKDI
jgi:polyisoprenoid-binding protein YceI